MQRIQNSVEIHVVRLVLIKHPRSKCVIGFNQRTIQIHKMLKTDGQITFKVNYGQSSGLHSLFSLVALHGLPPFLGLVTLLRVLLATPPPHDLEQELH